MRNGCGRLILLLLAAAAAAGTGRAQSYRSLVHEGNDLYRQKQYGDARVSYEKSVKRDSGRLEGYFNLGNALYRSGDQKSAIEQYMKAIPRVRDTKQAEQSLYNIGNSFLNAGETAEKAGAQAEGQGSQLAMEAYRNAVTAYKKALKVDPKDEDARYNLAYTQRKLDLLQKQNQQQNQNKDQNKQDQKKQNEQQKQDQQKNDQQKNEDKKQQQQQQNQTDQKGKEQDAQKQPQQPEQDKNKMSKQEAERILDALKNDEKDLQKKIRAKARVRYQVDKDW